MKTETETDRDRDIDQGSPIESGLGPSDLNPSRSKTEVHAKKSSI